MKSKPNLAAFISGGVDQPVAAQTAALSEPTPVQAIATDRVNKTIRISKALENKLKREALRLSEKTGARVTESDLIERALQAMFAK